MSKRYFLWGGMYLNVAGIELVPCQMPPGFLEPGDETGDEDPPQWFRQASWPDPPTDEVYVRFKDCEPDHANYYFKEQFSERDAAEMREHGQVCREEEVSEEQLERERLELEEAIRNRPRRGRRGRRRPEAEQQEIESTAALLEESAADWEQEIEQLYPKKAEPLDPGLEAAIQESLAEARQYTDLYFPPKDALCRCGHRRDEHTTTGYCLMERLINDDPCHCREFRLAKERP